MNRTIPLSGSDPSYLLVSLMKLNGYGMDKAVYYYCTVPVGWREREREEMGREGELRRVC